PRGQRPGAGRALLAELLGGALARLEAGVRLADDVHPAPAAHHLAVLVALLEAAERVDDLHGNPRERWARRGHADPRSLAGPPRGVKTARRAPRARVSTATCDGSSPWAFERGAAPTRPCVRCSSRSTPIAASCWGRCAGRPIPGTSPAPTPT